MITDSALIFVIAMVGGLLPLAFKRSDRGLHLLVAVATGIFLGVVFTHLLPEVGEWAREVDQQAHQTHAEKDGHDHDGKDHDRGGSDGQGHDKDGADHTEGDGHAHDEGDGHAHDEGDGHAHDEGDGHAHDEQDDGHSDGEGDAHAHSEGDGHQHPHGTHSELWLFVLAGVLILYLLENLVFRKSGQHDHHGHDQRTDHQHHITVGYAAFFGLGVHALTAGFSLAAMQSDLILMAILCHKGAEGFSLCTVFRLANFSIRKTVILLVAFACLTPAGVLLGNYFMDGLDGFASAAVAALAAGTFLYVSLCDLLPEVFHRRVDAWLKVGLLLLGIVLSVLIHDGAHAHG